MTAEEFTRWATSPEGAAILGVGGVSVTYVLYETGAISWVVYNVARRLKAGWNADKPRAFVHKTAKATSLVIALGASLVSFDGAYAKNQTPDHLTEEVIAAIYRQNPSKIHYVSRTDIYAAIVKGQSQLG